MKNKTILVTGGSGYIGSHFVWTLVNAGMNPVIFDIQPPANVIHRRAEYFQGDVNNVHHLEDAFSKYAPMYTVHLAAQTHIVSDHDSRGNLWDVNTGGSTNVLATAITHGCRRIIFTSSSAVYGDAMGPIKETKALRPVSMYGKTKKFFEEILVREAKRKSISAVILRLFNVAGYDLTVPLSPRVKGRDTLITNAINSQLQNTTLTIYGSEYATKDGTAVRDYVHVTDVVHALVTAISYQDSNLPLIANIGSGQGVTNLEVVGLIEGLTRRSIRRTFVHKRRGEVGHSIANIGLASRALDWSPHQSSLRRIIQSSIDAYEK